MSNQPPLNPDALEAAATELFFTITAHKSAADVLGFDWKKLPTATRAPWETASSKVVAAYLSALPDPPEGWEAQAKNFMRVIDRLSAENEALKAAALPEVTSVEELDQLPDDTVALDDAGAVLRKWTANEWYATGDDQSYMNTEIGLPARVLYLPSEQP